MRGTFGLRCHHTRFGECGREDKEVSLADKSSQLLIDALSRAATDPQGVALFGSKSEPGLFPMTGSAKLAAQRCKDEGYLQVVRSEPRGKRTREICILTDKGLTYLVRQACPRQVVEDFLRTLEMREQKVEQLLRSAHTMAQSLQSMRSAVEQVLPRLHDRSDAPLRNGSLNGKHEVTSPAEPAKPPLWTAVLAKLSEWHDSAGASEDCPLPRLYRQLTPEGGKPPSIGEFHDCLRLLHDEHQIYLHPWTGPLYDLPEPAFALLIGHEIAYYASRR